MLRTSHANGRRRGVILIVVLSLLVLFAIVGITFVLVSDQLALSARIAREAETTFRPNSDPEGAFAYFLGQLVYDAPDDERGIYSGLRGHSFARTMYGYNDQTPYMNNEAFSGVGRMHLPSPFAGNGSAGQAQWLDYMVNHTYFAGDGFLLDPERTIWRNGNVPKTAPFVSAAAPYTYPDHNSFFLGMQNPTDGKIQVQSYHRPWLFGPLSQANPNWTNASGKYLTLRPRPAENPGFPYPEDPGGAGSIGGDVKNLLGAPGGNDSIWIDVGAPVMTSADGRKYKMLFAPLILDMDGRINITVAGNARAAGNAHASHQGWGPWEINPQRVLAGGAAELQQILDGTPFNATSGQPYRTAGRYGSDRRPGVSGNQAPTGTGPRVWGQVDFDAIDDGTGAIGSPFLLPGEATTLPYQPYPSFPPAFGNGSNAERLDHPLLYNPFRPYNDDRALAASNMASLLRRGGTGSQGLTTELSHLLPQTYNDVHRRNLITTHSADIDRPGATPYVWDRTAAGSLYAWNAANGYPSAVGPIISPFDNVAGNRSTFLPGSEFDPGFWHSNLASLLRVNLNRVPRYPTVAPIDHFTAWTERVQLADDLFDRLWRVTGAPDPSTVAVNTNEFRTLQWLAQLAANMVDAVDDDDVMTVYPWYPVGVPRANRTNYVIGTEQPSLVINEAYAQADNVDTDTGIINITPIGNRKANDGYRLHVWTELLNPRVSDASFNNTVNLLINGQANQPAYQLVLAPYDNVSKGRNVLNDTDNVYGNPNSGLITTKMAVSTVQDWAVNNSQILPLKNAYANPAGNPTNGGFFTVGPQTTYLTDAGDANVKPADPNLIAAKTSHQSPSMRLILPAGAALGDYRPTILLRRLACPSQPLNDPASGAFNPALLPNPFVTIDAFHLSDLANGEVNDARSYDGNGVNGAYVPVANRVAFGRRQPFAAIDYVAQNPNRVPAPNPDEPKHTFYRHNGIDPTPPAALANYFPTDPNQTIRKFDWLVHLDRQVVSPIELLNVSAWKPHQLTAKFFQGGVPHQQVARWFDPTTRLHRFLEFVQTAPRTNGVHAGGRIPGKVNINTMMDPAVFSAVCDAQAGNRFNDTQVQNVFQMLMAQRSPSITSGNPFSTPDRPFWSLAQGESPGGDQWTTGLRGIENTLLAPITGGNANSPRLLDPLGGAAHPYHNLELLNKIYKNVTTRSNVFAVWVTVGYFEVTNENARPVQLGAEIGRAEGRHIRHRFFALIDRTKMEAFRGTVNVAADQSVSIQGTNTTPPLNGSPWLPPVPSEGTLITFNPDLSTAVTAVMQGGKAVSFPTMPAGTYPAVIYGNPGPWTGPDATSAQKSRYSPKKDPCVLYFALID